MAEYIEREWLMRKVNSFVSNVLCRGHKEMITLKDSCNPNEWTRGYKRGALDIAHIVGARPTEDVVEVRHGEWLDDSCDYVCSVCRAAYSDEIRYMNRNFEFEMPNYCPNCGAKMDGKGEE